MKYCWRKKILTDKEQSVIKELETDITYFKNVGFDTLASKFQRDLDIIKGLVKED